MAQNFTPEDLVQYLYKETTPEQNAAIEQRPTPVLKSSSYPQELKPYLMC
jgi:hypothetical protein